MHDDTFELSKDEDKIIKLNSKRENTRNEITRSEAFLTV